jgi:hypothetical protein
LPVCVVVGEQLVALGDHCRFGVGEGGEVADADDLAWPVRARLVWSRGPSNATFASASVGSCVWSMQPPPPELTDQLIESYQTLGLPMPEVFTVWTSFPMNGNNIATWIDPLGNDVTGIGFEDVFPADGLKDPSDLPTRAVLLHNNILAMPERASVVNAPVDGYARYLFLLELSHVWGPRVRVPMPNEGELIGFPSHWSFFMDAGGSPAGGNVWTDNGDGTFTVVPGDPATLKYSMIDLYLMGLASPDEVEPFGVLTNVTVPRMPTDPNFGGAFSAQSFPWFDRHAAPFRVTATRRGLTVDDVIAANGVRTPEAGVKTSYTVAIVLLVPENADAATIAAAENAFAPIADSLAPAFADATRQRGTLEIVTKTTPRT